MSERGSRDWQAGMLGLRGGVETMCSVVDVQLDICASAPAAKLLISEFVSQLLQPCDWGRTLLMRVHWQAEHILAMHGHGPCAAVGLLMQLQFKAMVVKHNVQVQRVLSL